MTKSDLIEHVSSSQNIPKSQAEVVVDLVFDCLAQALNRNERIEIRGFGSFEMRTYQAYEGRNPRTGEAVPVKPKRLPFFKVGKDLRDRVNATAGAPDDVKTTQEVPAVASASTAPSQTPAEPATGRR